MELQQLRYFVATAECRNVTRAAERCHVAQPSLSQQLKKLEEDLGAKLFDRLGRGVALTDAGRALLPRAKRILSEVRETEANLKRESGHGRGALVIGAIATMAPYLLPTALRKLRASHPDYDLSIREDLTEHLVEALVDNEIDCALVSTPLAHELLEVEVLAEEELLVAVAKAHPAATRPEIAFPDLRDEATVSLEDMHCLGRQIVGFCTTRQMTPRVVCRMTQLSTILELVALGVGVSIVPEMAAAADRSGRCSYLRIRPGKPTRQIAVAWREGRTRPAAAVQFVRCVKENFASGKHSLPPLTGQRS